MNHRETERYLRARSEEIDLRSTAAGDATFRTVYFGGGTPTLLQPAQLQHILDGIHRRYNIDPDAEITIEANPEQLTLDFCKLLKTLGFNG